MLTAGDTTFFTEFSLNAALHPRGKECEIAARRRAALIREYQSTRRKHSCGPAGLLRVPPPLRTLYWNFFNFPVFLKVYFIDYAITVVHFSPLPRSAQYLPSFGNPPLVRVRGSCVEVLWLLHLLCYS